MKEGRWKSRARLKRPVLISLLHPTVRPDIWHECCQNWYSNCDNPNNVEYVLVPEQSKFPMRFKPNIPFSQKVVEWNTHQATLVGGNNCAAEVSHGTVLVGIADRYFSAPHWDTLLLGVLGDRVNSETVVWAHQNTRDPELMVHAILTRPYYMKLGHIYSPEYTDWYADNEFHEVAARDGVILDARDQLRFNKVNTFGDEFEKQYELSGEKSRDTYLRRKSAGFPKGT